MAAKLTPFRSWIEELEVDVIQSEFGFEPGEFTVYREHWRPAWREGLTPLAAFRRALDASAEARRERDEDRKANYERIKRDDAALLSQHQGGTDGR